MKRNILKGTTLLTQLTLGKAINLYLKKKKIFIIFRFGKAIGDQVCMTGIIREIYKKYKYKTIVFTSYPELFMNNPRIYKIYSINNIKFKKFVLFLLLALEGEQIREFRFKGTDEEYHNYMRETKSKEHLAQVFSKHFNLDLDFTNFKNEFFFSSEEIKRFSKKFDLPKNYAVVLPVSKKTYTPNKDWGFENYQKVINLLSNIKWVQVGLKREPLLQGVIDLRGKTTLRELIFIISRASFILANEGLLNHIASAFENVKSFVVFSGFHLPSIAKYKNTFPIVQQKMPPCTPCWLTIPCPNNKACMKDITPKLVVSVIKKYFNNLQ